MSGLKLPMAVTTFSALADFIKAKFDKETKDGIESSVGDFDDIESSIGDVQDFEETISGKWMKIQNILERIQQYSRENELNESDLRFIMTPAVVKFIDKLQTRMAKCTAEASDPKNALKADLNTVHNIIEDNLSAALVTKEKLAERKEAADRALAERKEAADRALAERKEVADRALAERKEAEERLHQEREGAADRALALKIAQLQYQQKQCCSVM